MIPTYILHTSILAWLELNSCQMAFTCLCVHQPLPQSRVYSCHGIQCRHLYLLWFWHMYQSYMYIYMYSVHACTWIDIDRNRSPGSSIRHRIGELVADTCTSCTSANWTVPIYVLHSTHLIQTIHFLLAS